VVKSGSKIIITQGTKNTIGTVLFIVYVEKQNKLVCLRNKIYLFTFTYYLIPSPPTYKLFSIGFVRPYTH